MNATINERERGFLFRNGRFMRMLEPGGHFAPSFLGYEVVTEAVSDEPFTDEITLAAYGRDKKFLELTSRVEVKDGQKALHFVDGRFADILRRGTYVYWNIFKNHSFQIIDMSNESPIDEIDNVTLEAIPEPYCKKAIIKDNERGFLFRNGCFVRMLAPGVHAVPAFLMYNSVTVVADGEPFVDERELSTYGKDAEFASSVARVDVADGQIALHYVNGRYTDALNNGVYAYWRIFDEHTFKIIDITDEGSLSDIPASVLETLPHDICAGMMVEDWQAVLLYIDGAFIRRLPSGRHFFWRKGKDVSWAVYDMRTTQLDVSGQEILTSDKVALRVNFVCSFRITDPLAVHNRLKDHSAQIYAAAQLALRELLGGMRFDEVLEIKDTIAGRVLDLLKRNEAELFVEFVGAGMKDIILPGEIRDIMNTVLVAEKRAQANVITRREEVASTRSLLNTARLMDENATLYKLKELEYLERICDKVDSIKVNNASGLLEQLGAMMKV